MRVGLFLKLDGGVEWGRHTAATPFSQQCLAEEVLELLVAAGRVGEAEAKIFQWKNKGE